MITAKEEKKNQKEGQNGQEMPHFFIKNISNIFKALRIFFKILGEEQQQQNLW